MAEMVNIYRLKVSLLDVPINQLHRVIELAGNAPFSVLHDMIFLAFDRYDPHLYKFLLTYREVKNRLNEQGQQQMQILARLMQDNPAHEK